MNSKESTEHSVISQNEIESVVKKKRGAKWIQETTDIPGENMQPGDVSRYVRMSMASWNLPPVDISDPVQVEQRINDYFQFCADNDRKPQIIGMANWLGVDRSTINSWKRGEYRKDTHSPLIQKAVDTIEEMWVDFMLNGKINPAAGIFIAKNHLGYRDETQVVVTPNNPLQDLDAQEARKRITESIVETEEE